MNTSPSSWHALSVRATLDSLHAVASGLSGTDAAERLQKDGPNRLSEGKGVTALQLLLEQFKNILILILIFATILSAVLGHEVEAIAIGVIVLFAVILGFLQEFRAEKAMEALKTMSAPTATVIRDGKEREIPASDVVAGDIILLAAGDRVPADARLIESHSLQIDEAALTGESMSVEKDAEMIAPENASVGDRRNMAYAGTVVTYGRGKAVVAATGMKTEFGKIATLLQGVEREQTPLQKNLDKVGKALAQAALGIVIVISLLGYFRGEPLLDILIFGIALAVAVVPEALPAVVTISLAIGVQRMVKRNALIRRLPAVETLGSTTVICTDKTGTLTKDEMTIRRIFAGGQTFDVTGSGYAPSGAFVMNEKEMEPSDAVLELLRGGVLSSDATLVKEEDRHDIKGDPTEGAFVVAAAKAGLLRDSLDKSYPRIDEIPFTSETKRMTTLHKTETGHIAYAKGAAEMILKSCTRQWGPEGELPLTEEDRKKILDAAQAMATSAMRVLAVARKGNEPDIAKAGQDLKFIGLVGMIDPPRPEAKKAISQCHAAGIRVIMITGDHPVTAEAIARELGLLTDQKVMTGAQLEEMDETAFEREVDQIGVYARVSPAHKLRVVTALQKKGEIVAMTGDGVNDAPALKKADIGIAMGITGTDVTKEAAAMTLLDDNFASIVAAVEEGRGIYGNIKKYLMYLLAANIGEIGLMTGATLLGWPLPLSAVQILYVNLATDGLPALALAVDPPEKDLMQRPPRNPRQSIFTRPVVMLMLIGGLWSTVANLFLFGWALRTGRAIEEAMTMSFVTLVLIEFFKAYAFRSERHSTFMQPFANRWLNMAVGWEILLLIAIVYLPILHLPFGTFSLTLEDWLILLVTAATIVPVLEVAKWMERREWFGKMV